MAGQCHKPFATLRHNARFTPAAPHLSAVVIPPPLMRRRTQAHRTHAAMMAAAQRGNRTQRVHARGVCRRCKPCPTCAICRPAMLPETPTGGRPVSLTDARCSSRPPPARHARRQPRQARKDELAGRTHSCIRTGPRRELAPATPAPAAYLRIRSSTEPRAGPVQTRSQRSRHAAAPSA